VFAHNRSRCILGLWKISPEIPSGWRRHLGLWHGGISPCLLVGRHGRKEGTKGSIGHRPGELADLSEILAQMPGILPHIPEILTHLREVGLIRNKLVWSKLARSEGRKRLSHRRGKSGGTLGRRIGRPRLIAIVAYRHIYQR